MDLLALAYEHTVDAVDMVQSAISDEPYSILKKIPIIREVSSPIEEVHKDILNTIYFSLRAGGKLAHKGAKALGEKRSRKDSQA